MQLFFPNYSKVWAVMSFFSPLRAFLTFLWVLASGRISLESSSLSAPKFRLLLQNHFQGSLYFSFLPVKQRDFPGNTRSGGCDSLLLVVAFTSKQHDSQFKYALHFLHIISHQMCCAGGRVEGGTSSARSGKKKKKKIHLLGKSRLQQHTQGEVSFAFIADAWTHGSLICCLFWEKAGPQSYPL